MAGKVLVTGASGFLGRILCDGLKDLGYELLMLGRQKGNDLQLDLTQPNPELPKIDRVEMVIHAAGKAHIVPRTPKEEQEFFDVNFEGTKKLCNALTRADIKPLSFIFISTVSVYGCDSGQLINEDHPLLGATPYAKSKILAEQWLKDWAAGHLVKLIILRLPLVAGPNPPGNLGAMIKGIRSGRYFSIGSASAKKSVVWAADIVKILPSIAGKEGVFNLTDGYDPSFRELETGLARAMNTKKVRRISYLLAKTLALAGDMMGRRAPVNSDKLKKIMSTLTFDTSRAGEILGWKPNHVIEKLPEMI